MYCIYKPLADCICCGRCDKAGQDNRWNFSTESGREKFLDEMWNFIFAGNAENKRKNADMELLLQKVLEELEEQILECAEKHSA